MSTLPDLYRPKQWPTAPAPLPPDPRRGVAIQPQQMILLILLALEISVFSITGTNFANSGQHVIDTSVLICRLSVDVGLLALALTPVILTGGIDLSVGSMLGLS